MKIIQEYFWKKIELPSMYIITTNGIIGDNNELVMGLGIAREATKKIKGIKQICGKIIKEKGMPIDKYNSKFLYYFLPILENKGKNFFGIFQVKLDWRKGASLDIIEKSCMVLSEYIRKNPNINYRMNFPGVGAGKLSVKEVLPVLEKYLYDKNIIICTSENTYSEYIKLN
jgi:hypothetical protein